MYLKKQNLISQILLMDILNLNPLIVILYCLCSSMKGFFLKK